MTTNLHAHISTYAVDCDGPMYHDYVYGITAEEASNEFADLVFKARVLDSQTTFCSEFGQTIVITEGGFTTEERTDEGGRSAEVRWCEDACDTGKRSQRDVYAEQMGY